MARKKDPNELSPAYRRRIESALKRGLNRHQARGHNRADRGELSARSISKLSRLPESQTVLLRSVVNSGDAVERKLYALAERERFAKQQPFSSSGPTAFDKLLSYRRGKFLLEDSEFQDYPGEAFTNVEDINTFQSVLDDVERFIGEDDEDGQQQITDLREQLDEQKQSLYRENKITPRRWGNPNPQPKKRSRKKK